jgi:transcriptional regulator with PAS, ATPase and Fis domain
MLKISQIADPTFSNVQNTAKMTAEDFRKEEELITKAVNSYKHQKVQNISRTAREFGVSRDRLSRRIKGIPTH